MSDYPSEPQAPPTDASRLLGTVALLGIVGTLALVVFLGQRDTAAVIATIREESAARAAHQAQLMEDLRSQQHDNRGQFQRMRERMDLDRKASDDRFDAMLKAK